MFKRLILPCLAFIVAGYAQPLPSYTLLNKPLGDWFDKSDNLQYVTLKQHEKCDVVHVYAEDHNLRMTWQKAPTRTKVNTFTEQKIKVCQILHNLGLESKDDYYVAKFDQNACLIDRKFCCMQTPLLFEQTFTFQADPDSPSLLREVILEKLPGFESVIVNGIIDFDKPFNALLPLPGQKFFYTKGAQVTLVFDPSRVKR